jgi:Tfp pilus assembly protein PilO
MVNHLIAWSLDNRFVVMLLAVVLLITSAFSSDT